MRRRRGDLGHRHGPLNRHLRIPRLAGPGFPAAAVAGIGATGFWIAWLSNASLKVKVANWPSFVIVTLVSPTWSDHWMLEME